MAGTRRTRSMRPQRDGKEEGPILLFDGVCNLCSGAVRFVLARERHREIRFASLQSRAGGDLLERAGLPRHELDTLVLLEGGEAYLRSGAVLRIVGELCGAWPLLRALRVIPGPVRDVVYDSIAKRRYRWFGRRDTCLVPDATTRERFLDADEPSADVSSD